MNISIYFSTGKEQTVEIRRRGSNISIKKIPQKFDELLGVNLVHQSNI